MESTTNFITPNEINVTMIILKTISIQRGIFFSVKNELTGEKRMKRNEAITKGTRMLCNSERRIPSDTSPMMIIKKTTGELSSIFSFMPIQLKLFTAKVFKFLFFTMKRCKNYQKN